jgi:hypothetical protein
MNSRVDVDLHPILDKTFVHELSMLQRTHSSPSLFNSRIRYHPTTKDTLLLIVSGHTSSSPFLPTKLAVHGRVILMPSLFCLMKLELHSS